MPIDPPSDPQLDQPHPPIHDHQSVEEKLDVIIKYLHRIDKRDRIRMWSGTIHSLLMFIPVILTLLSLWYFYAHMGEIIGGMVGGMMPGGGSADQQSIIDQIQEYFRQQQ